MFIITNLDLKKIQYIDAGGGQVNSTYVDWALEL